MLKTNYQSKGILSKFSVPHYFKWNQLQQEKPKKKAKIIVFNNWWKQSQKEQ